MGGFISGFTFKIYHVSCGRSENGRPVIHGCAEMWVCLKIEYIPNEIAIFHRDNDQQNQTGFRGTQHFQTHPHIPLVVITIINHILTIYQPSLTIINHILIISKCWGMIASLGERRPPWSWCPLTTWPTIPGVPRRTCRRHGEPRGRGGFSMVNDG